MNYGFVKTQFGWCGAVEEDGKIVKVYLPSPAFKETSTNPSPLIKHFLDMAVTYFDNREPVDFSVLPVNLYIKGSFSIRTYTWLMRNLKWGQTITYGELAKVLNNPMGARAVGRVLNRNPIPLIVPCHRVVGRNGLGGFSSSILLKAEMLKIEGVNNPRDNELLSYPVKEPKKQR